MSNANWTKEDLAAHYSKLTNKSAAAPMSPRIALPPAPPKAKGYVPAPKGMNRTEQAYGDHLQRQLRAGTITWWGFEAMTFKLATDTRYTPDFIVMMADASIRCIDTKGTRANKATGTSTYFAEEDSKIKIKVAAKMFPFFRWSYAFKDKTGEWQEVVFE